MAAEESGHLRGLELLLEPAGWDLLDALPPYDAAAALRLGQGLRDRGLDPDLVAAALTQSRLRAKASAKFGPFAARMLFSDDGLAQATRLVVAAHHAERYRGAGIASVADLTAGIGGDTLAFAGLGLRVAAYERDDVTRALLTVNMRLFPEVTVHGGDGLAADLSGVEGVWADPARRVAGRRVFDPAAYTPPLGQVLELRHDHALGIKVGPGIAHADIPAGAEAQWVSVDGDTVECALWFGPLRGPAIDPDSTALTALVLRGERAHPLASSAPHPAAPTPVGALGGYLAEPDGAVIRAGLVGEVAQQISGRLISPRIAYLTTDIAPTTPFARGYRILDSFGFNLKKLRSYLRERGVGIVEIKKRGTALTPEELRSRLDLRGDASATLVLTRLGETQSVIVVEALD